MKRFLAILLSVLLITVTGIAVVQAQDEDTADSPFALLSFVPNNEQSRLNILYFTDYEAAVNARPGAIQPNSWAEWDAQADTLGGALWLAVMRGISGSPPVFQNLFVSEGTADLMGFDLFEFQQTVEFGEIPNQGNIIGGDFDPDAITSALTSRDYTESELNGITLLCGSAGCEEGTMMNIMARDPANPFGGDLGREQPILVTSDYLVTSPSIETVESIAETIAGEQESIADVPGYQSAMAVIESQGIPLQAVFAPPTFFLSDPAMVILGAETTFENIEELSAKLGFDEENPLPPYELVVLADVAQESDELTVIVVVYSNEELGETALPILDERFNNYQSLRAEQSWSELMEARDMSAEDWQLINDEETGKTLVVKIMRKPRPPAEEVDDDGFSQIIASSMGYQLFVQALYTRDMGWLQIG